MNEIRYGVVRSILKLWVKISHLKLPMDMKALQKVCEVILMFEVLFKVMYRRNLWAHSI